MKRPKGEARRRELFRYLDARLPKHWLPARYLGNTALLGEGPDIFTGIKPLGGEPEDRIDIVFAGNARGTLVFTFSDGDPVQLADFLTTTVLADAFVHPLHAYGLMPIVANEYLRRQGFDVALFVRPDWLRYSERVAHQPRSLRHPWHILMMLLLTKHEHKLARTDTNALLDHFESVRRDFMTVHAPYKKPA